MIGEQIRDGDCIIVESRQIANNGEMVVALVDGSDATVKTFFKERDQIRLEPANPRYKPIIVNPPDRVTIQGVVKGLIRKDKRGGTDKTSLAEGFYRRHYLLTVIGGFDFAKYLGDLAVLVDEVSNAGDSPVLPAVHSLFLPRPVLLAHFVIHVGKQREIQSVLFGEFLMRLLAVRGDAQHDCTELLYCADVIPKRAGLNRAARSQVLRVKVQNHLLPFEIRELDLVPVAVAKRELRSLVSN